MANLKLTVKQDKFVKAYLLNGGNANQAAIKAGYSVKTSYSIGQENMTKPAIKHHLLIAKELIEENLYKGIIEELSDLRGEVKRLKTIVGEGGGGRMPTESNRYGALERAGFKCQCCGDKPRKNNDVVLHIDHILPFSKGGDNEMDNLQSLCARCNLAKSNFYDFNHNEEW